MEKLLTSLFVNTNIEKRVRIIINNIRLVILCVATNVCILTSRYFTFDTKPVNRI